ncbi:MAG TPA: hypothetical protein VN958_00370 [Chitinophagaceae bacterium]|nr:hypothetical protein [Chitinophagaceae bacterium]
MTVFIYFKKIIIGLSSHLFINPKSSYGKPILDLFARSFYKATNNSYCISTCISTCHFGALQHREGKRLTSYTITKENKQ